MYNVFLSYPFNPTSFQLPLMPPAISLTIHVLFLCYFYVTNNLLSLIDAVYLCIAVWPYTGVHATDQ